MFRICFFLCFFCSVHTLAAQDSSLVNNEDTLVRQRFIDRYDNVFMTRVPTRHIIKAGFTPNNPLEGFGGINYAGTGATSLLLGYEFKVTPAFSLGISAWGTAGASGIGTIIGSSNFVGKLGFSGQVRWYNRMAGRVRAGLSASNFTGDYFGLTYDRLLMTYYGDKAGYQRVGLEYGLQRRFLNHGFLDFGAGVYYNDKWRGDTGSDVYVWLPASEIVTFGTRTALGFAFGDWKKAKTAPSCEVFRCDEKVGSQWKVGVPYLRAGLKHQTASATIAFERKFFKSFSVNLELDGFLTRSVQKIGNKGTTWTLDPEAQLRYYYNHRRLRAKGKGGYNLSGFYTGIRAGYSHVNTTGKNAWGSWRTRSSFWDYGVLLGYQQALLQHVYIDVNMFTRFGQKSAAGGIGGSLGLGFRF